MAAAGPDDFEVEEVREARPSNGASARSKMDDQAFGGVREWEMRALQGGSTRTADEDFSILIGQDRRRSIEDSDYALAKALQEEENENARREYESTAAQQQARRGTAAVSPDGAEDSNSASKLSEKELNRRMWLGISGLVLVNENKAKAVHGLATAAKVFSFFMMASGVMSMLSIFQTFGFTMPLGVGHFYGLIQKTVPSLELSAWVSLIALTMGAVASCLRVFFDTSYSSIFPNSPSHLNFVFKGPLQPFVVTGISVALIIINAILLFVISSAIKKNSIAVDENGVPIESGKSRYGGR
mmetsp:Transcript_50412/g.129864  ORF Transcript_50412/g.129864 Transcript_50412/m.129864 type:complete len:299 (-) Transcript_50412:438-1334(-)